MKRSIYQMFNIPPDATVEQIEAAYAHRLRELMSLTARNDADAINEERMLKEGREILLNPASRAAYDQRLLDPDSTIRRQVLFMPEDRKGRGKLGVQTVVLVIVVAVLAGVVYRHFSKKLDEMDRAYRQEMAQQRIDRVPQAQTPAPSAEEKTKPPAPLVTVAPAAEAGKGEQK